MSSHDDHNDEVEKSQREQQNLLQNQINQSNAEIEQERKAVFTQRLNIIRAQGAPVWNTGKNTPSIAPMSAPGKTKNPLQLSPIGNMNNNPLNQRGK